MAAFATSGKLNIGYKGKMFKQPKCEFTVAHVVPEGEDEAETKLLRAAYAKIWEKNFTKLEKKRSELTAFKENLDKPNRLYQEYLTKIKKWEQAEAEMIGDNDSPGSIKYL